MNKLKLFLIGSTVAAALSCGGAAVQNSGPANASATPATPAATPKPDAVAIGRSLYEQNCASCHKEDGTGGKMTIEGKTLDVDDLTSDKIKKFSDEKITGYIVNGIEDEGMPAFEGRLSDDEIKSIVRYVRGGIQKMNGKLPAPPAP